jgi:hypothetical protein
VPNAVNVAPDGDVIGAKQRLSDAISKLIDPKPETRHLEDGGIKIEWLDSCYTQLVEAVPGERRHRAGVSASTPPLWIDASDLRHLIDQAVTGWEPHWPIPLPTVWEWAYEDDWPTVQRLKLLEKRRFRPQDTHLIDSYTNSLLGWCDKIRDLLTDAPKCTLPNPCPACGVGVVYREYAGEQVRRPALQISAEGCTCQHCRYTWSPSHFSLLAATLGYPLPEGVLQ